MVSRSWCRSKVCDRKAGEIAKDAVSGEALMAVGVVCIDEGETSLIQVIVSEGGVTDGLTVGAPVSLPSLVVRPWGSVFSGRQPSRIGSVPSFEAMGERPPDRREKEPDSGNGDYVAVTPGL
ncbi:hypothetical protein AB0G32_01665 [Streptomyces sp. NPDC023723]|uniref:hypothetical protein n=1 Tax=Streptomyces sp. NPDC023723 TaxID=3154323 RepID=UPI003403AC2E